MRIVYDDKYIDKLCELIADFMRTRLKKTDLARLTEYRSGMNRIQRDKLRAHLNSFLQNFRFEIGNETYHAYGIGNNERRPVYYKEQDGEMLHTGYIHINIDLHSSAFVYITDYNGEKRSVSYEVSPNGVR